MFTPPVECSGVRQAPPFFYWHISWPILQHPLPVWHVTHREASPGIPLSLLCFHTQRRRQGRGRFWVAPGRLRPGTQSLSRMTKSCLPCPRSPVFFLQSDIWAHCCTEGSCRSLLRYEGGCCPPSSIPSSDHRCPGEPRNLGTAWRPFWWRCL